MINIGIIGLGFVGNSMFESFKLKGMQPNVASDILFLALPTIYNSELGQYDKTPIKETCELLTKFTYKGIIVIKSTVEPETTNNLSEEFKQLEFIHNP